MYSKEGGRVSLTTYLEAKNTTFELHRELSAHVYFQLKIMSKIRTTVINW